MPVSLASELWSELKRYISTVDRDEAADTVVNILIDNDIDIEEIKANFKGDTEIKRALSQFTEDVEEEDVEEEYDEDEY
jgi:hypothetical protein